MTVVYDVPASALIKELSEELKKANIVKPPEWALYVKTGTDRERPPENEDWWYTRSASLLRKIYVHGPVGIPTLRRVYGGKKNMGFRPEHKKGGSGSIIKNILKQLESAGLVQKTSKGRVITSKGTTIVDKVSNKVKRAASEQKKPQ